MYTILMIGTAQAVLIREYTTSILLDTTSIQCTMYSILLVYSEQCTVYY